MNDDTITAIHDLKQPFTRKKLDTRNQKYTAREIIFNETKRS